MCFIISCRSIDKVFGVEHFELFLADHAELLVLVVEAFEPLLEVQVKIHFEDT